MKPFERTQSVIEDGLSSTRRARHKRGFTLTHLLGVILLLAIPATILFPMIATPNHAEAAVDDDADAVPKQDQEAFIKTVADMPSSKSDFSSELALFRTWARETQGAVVTFSPSDRGATLTAYFTSPSTRKVAVIRAKRLHWYYTYLRRSYFPRGKSTVLVVDANGRTIAACHGVARKPSRGLLPKIALLRWPVTGMPSTQAVHHTMDSGLRRIAAATHGL